MAGIYIHIPFCKQICHYCDFYKVGSSKRKEDFLASLLNEIELRKEKFKDPVETIYFGGGTPSVFSVSEMKKIVNQIQKNYTLAENIEFTIEANPDDVSLDYYKGISDIGVNRLSIGIQSFNEDILKYLNRRHSSSSAIKSVELAQKAGFTNISLDLIYGVPSQTILDFISDLSFIFRLNVPHLSAYHLTIEDNTYFGKLKNAGRLSEIDEGLSELFYDTLVDWAYEYMFEHYELSNFAKDGLYSKHNKNYWFNVPYLSFGPSAHSLINNTRYHNVSNLNEYIENINDGKEFIVEEKLTEINRFNEYVMLRLRTKWGLSLDEVAHTFGTDFHSHILRIFSKFEDSGYLRLMGDQLSLTEEGFFVSDFLFSEFFINS